MFLSTLFVTFGMFSAIPVPFINWNHKNMKYVFCFLPAIGLLIGIVESFWIFGAVYFQINEVFTAAVFTAIPVLVTGGIHLDGFCDVSDALSSHAKRERMLEIMKDSHCGAFAVIHLALYFLLYFGATCQMRLIAFIGWFVTSRILAGLAVSYLPNARGKGMLLDFSSEMDRIKVQRILWGMLVLGLTVWLYFFPWECLAMVGASAIVSAYFYRMCKRRFGGITGDLAGWYICMLELSAALGLAFQNVLF